MRNATQGLPPGKYAYDCPADTQLDVSWHQAGASVRNPLMRLLIEPSWGNVQALFVGAAGPAPATGRHSDARLGSQAFDGMAPVA